MSKEELVEFLRESLKIPIDVSRDQWSNNQYEVNVQIILDTDDSYIILASDSCTFYTPSCDDR
jgi:hypothetical protein